MIRQLKKLGSFLSHLPRPGKNKEVPFEVEHFRAFVFQPSNSFYRLPFADRLHELENHIQQAQIYLKENPPQGKAIFVAPEYLFKDLSKKGSARYFSHQNKIEYVKQLKALSKKSNLILAPGTICWQKEKKTDKKIYYRNEIFFFHQGKVQKYKKRYPHINFDYDYSEITIKSDRDPEAKFFYRGLNDDVIKNIGKLSIGVEICYDSVNASLIKSVGGKKIDIQLVVADGVDEKDLEQDGLVLLKVERRDSQTTLIGVIENIVSPFGFTHPGFIPANNPIDINQMENLKYYTFNRN